MPIRKISDLVPFKECRHPDHEPPSMIVLKPGIYEHECAGCGHKRVIVAREEARLAVDDDTDRWETNPMHSWGLGRGD